MDTRRPEIIRLPTFTDIRGHLTVMEKEPFEVKRAFWIYQPSNMPRGQHAHQEGEQLIIAVNGGFTVKVKMGDEEFKWYLWIPNRAVYLPPGAWVELDDWSAEAVALVLCSTYYSENDLC